MVKVLRFLVVVLSFAELLLATSGNDQSLDTACNSVEVRELHSNLIGLEKRAAGMWFGPRLGKRSMASFNGDSDEDVQNSLFEVVLKRAIQNKLGLESPQDDVGWIVYLVSEKPNKVMTPRLGRDLGEKCLELHRSRPPFAPRLGKKTVSYFRNSDPFKYIPPEAIASDYLQ